MFGGSQTSALQQSRRMVLQKQKLRRERLKNKTGSGQPDVRSSSSSSSSSSSGGGSRRRHLTSHSSVAVLLPCSPAPVACMQLITHRVCSVLCQCPTGHLCQCPTGHRPAADAALNSPRTHRTLRRRRLRRTEHALLQFLLQLPRKLARAPPLGPRWPVQHAAQAHSECEGI